MTQFSAWRPLNRDLWNEPSIISNRAEPLGAVCVTYVVTARLCQSNPKEPQLCSTHNVSGITSPKYHFHDDTAGLAELLAFRHHFKMMTTVLFGWIHDGSLNFITFKPQHVLSILILLLPLFLLLMDGGCRKQQKKKITAQSCKVTDRFLSAEAQAEASLPCSSAANGEATYTPRKLSPCKGEYKSPPPQVAHWSVTGRRNKAKGDARKKPRRERQKGASRQWNVASHST